METFADARRLWQLYEPFHALTYFASDASDAFEEAGLRGFWRGYFAGRAAPLGAVGAGTVVATFHGFRRDFVERAVPAVWDAVTPARAIEARLEGVARTVRRLYGTDGRDAFVTAADLARRALDGCDGAGRPLYAANADLAWPDATAEPALALWHATTLLREHRGDGHVVALTHAGLDGCEASVLRLAVGGAGEDQAAWIRRIRGWDDADWAGATARLAGRGWLARTGAATTAGRDAHAAVEAATDRLAFEPVRRLGPDGLAALGAALRPIAGVVAESGVVPYPNPIGVPRA